jgi:hypothetical protein
MSVLHDPGNVAEIDELFVFMSIDDAGAHGIVASILPGLGSTPLVTGSVKGAEYMKKLAAQVSQESGKRVGMFVFKRADMVWSTDQ